MISGPKTLGSVSKNADGSFTINYVAPCTDINGVQFIAIVEQQVQQMADLQTALSGHLGRVRDYTQAANNIQSVIDACNAAK